MPQSEQVTSLSVAAQTSTHSISNLVPPWAYVIVGIISGEIGAAIAKQLFDTVGTSGVVLIRTSIAALIFLVLWRPKWLGYRPIEYFYLVIYGIMMATMMLAFYAAIDRIPLGIAVACGFFGPLGIALFTSRKILDLVWVAAAVVGIILVSPLTNTTLDLSGIVFALLSGLAWAAFMLLSGPIAKVFRNNSGLALAMTIVALTALPFGLPGVVHIINNVPLILLGIFVALLSSALPFTLQYQALKQLPARVYGILSSLEPVAATLVGFALLHEALEVKEVVGILLVTVAAVATTRQQSKVNS